MYSRKLFLYICRQYLHGLRIKMPPSYPTRTCGSYRAPQIPARSAQRALHTTIVAYLVTKYLPHWTFLNLPVNFLTLTITLQSTNSCFKALKMNFISYFRYAKLFILSMNVSIQRFFLIGDVWASEGCE